MTHAAHRLSRLASASALALTLAAPIGLAPIFEQFEFCSRLRLRRFALFLGLAGPFGLFRKTRCFRIIRTRLSGGTCLISFADFLIQPLCFCGRCLGLARLSLFPGLVSFGDLALDLFLFGNLSRSFSFPGRQFIR